MGKEKNKGTKVKWIVGIIVAISLCFLIGNLVVGQVQTHRVQRQLELGQQYLQEEKYEQALACFTVAVQIDNRCEEAYVGESYAYEGLKNMEESIDVLLEVTAELEGKLIRTRLEEIHDGQLEIAEDALQDEAYEEARNAFRLILRIDEDDENGKTGIVKVYTDWAGYLVDMGDYDAGISLLEEAVEETGSVDLRELLEEIKKIQDAMLNVKPIIEEIAACCSNEQYEDVYDLLNSDEYMEFINVTNKKDSYIFETEYGKLGIYELYAIYLGEYIGDKREGEGKWLNSWDDGYDLAKGTWVADMPNGKQEEIHILTDGASNGSKYRMKGIVKEGKWDGNVYVEWADMNRNEELHSGHILYHEGIPEMTKGNGRSDYYTVVACEQCGRSDLVRTSDQLQMTSGMFLFADGLAW